jgi:hypothetical protein
MEIELRRTLAGRMVRYVAVLSIVYAFATLAYALFYGGQFRLNTLIPFPSFDIGVVLAGLVKVNTFLLAVGAIALLSWQRWGRVCILVWAAATILISFASATYQSCIELGGGVYSLASFGWDLYSALQASLFPALVLLVLVQRDVAELWGPAHRPGFEVTPGEPVHDSRRSSAQVTVHHRPL